MKIQIGLTHIHGDTGTGKTTLAKALAWDFNCPPSIIFEQDSEHKIIKKEVFRVLKEYGRAIIIAEPYFIQQKGYLPHFVIECKEN